MPLKESEKGPNTNQPKKKFVAQKYKEPFKVQEFGIGFEKKYSLIEMNILARSKIEK